MTSTDTQALEYLEGLIQRRIVLDEKIAEMGKPKTRREKRLLYKPLVKERNFLKSRALSFVSDLISEGVPRKNIIEVVSRSTGQPPATTGQLVIIS